MFSSGKIDKYEYLTGEKILPSNQIQIMEKVEFTYTPLDKVFEKQTKAIQDQGESQIKPIEDRVENQKSISDLFSKDFLSLEAEDELNKFIDIEQKIANKEKDKTNDFQNFKK